MFFTSFTCSVRSVFFASSQKREIKAPITTSSVIIKITLKVDNVHKRILPEVVEAKPSSGTRLISFDLLFFFAAGMKRIAKGERNKNLFFSPFYSDFQYNTKGSL